MATDPRIAARIRLLELISNSKRLSTALRDTLEAERDAMKAQDTEALHRALDAKRLCVDQLRTLEQKRIAHCTQAGFPHGPAQMDDMADWCDDGTVIRANWASLLEVAANCQKLNHTIGAIIQTRRNQISKGLEILCGSDPSQVTYGAHGNDISSKGQRNLAEA